MRIKILNFKVTKTYELTDYGTWRKFWNRVLGIPQNFSYHFDIEAYVESELPARMLVELPNKVRLRITHQEELGMGRWKVKMGTYRFVIEDLRQYHPIEMYSVYHKEKTA